MLRGVVVGFGRMGLTHFSILNSHPDVEFVGACDSSSFVLRNVTKSLGIPTYKDYGRMIKETRPDFAIIATPTAMHADALQWCDRKWRACIRGETVLVESGPGTKDLDRDRRREGCKSGGLCMPLQ